MKQKTFFLLFLSLFISVHFSLAQQDTEFPKGFIMHIKLHNGLVTNFHFGADLYVGGLQLIPQITVVPNKLRLGANAGIFYTSQKLQAAIGPTLSWKLKTINAGPFGSAANIHLSLDHLWGSEHQRLLGGGIHVDLLNKIVLGITAHRDHYHSTWWFQNTVGLRISKVKKDQEPFNQ